MYIRRYYPKGYKYDKTYTDDYFEHMINEYGIDVVMEIDNANYEIIFENEDEKVKYISHSYERVLKDIRYYLDNLRDIPVISSKTVFDGKLSCFTTAGVRLPQKPKPL